jgi:hypothetical protein
VFEEDSSWSVEGRTSLDGGEEFRRGDNGMRKSGIREARGGENGMKGSLLRGKRDALIVAKTC